jgi:GNAT superfamily N-acetyltransferase
VKLRVSDASDLALVRRLIHLSIDSSYSGVYPPRAVQYFKDFHSLCRIEERQAAGQVLVVERDGEVVATGAIVGEEVTGVFVDPRFQKLGIGGQVMDRLEGIARAAGSTAVRLDVSLPSRGFYESRGYEFLESRCIDVCEGERLDYWAAEKSLGESEL